MGNRRWEVAVRLLQGLEQNRGEITGAEVGVWQGLTSSYMLANLPGLKKLFCVDAWQHYPDHTKTLKPKGKFINADMNVVFANFKEAIEPYRERVTIIRMFSNDAAGLIPNGSLDFVFIDGNHAYEYVREDIIAWLPKVKPGGIVMGHDWNIKGYMKSFGVNRAVNELLPGSKNIRYVWYKEV